MVGVFAVEEEDILVICAKSFPFGLPVVVPDDDGEGRLLVVVVDPLGTHGCCETEMDMEDDGWC